MVDDDNAGNFERLKLQIEPSPIRRHFVKTTVKVRHYADQSMGVFYRPRRIGRYGPDGRPINAIQNKAA